MNNYYYLATALPDLKIGQAPDISFQEFIILLRNNLSRSNFRQVGLYRSYFDVLNIKALIEGEPLDPRGNFDAQRLQEALVNPEALQKWTRSYFAKYDKKEERMEHFPELLSLYFQGAEKEAEGLLEKYLKFERQLRLVFVGFRAKKLKRDLLKELQFEDPDEELIAQIIAQKDAKEYEPPEGFEDLRAIFEAYQDDPMALHKALVEYRFDRVQQMMGLRVFNFDYVMGYMIQLVMVEKWLELDRKKGTEIVEKIVKGTK